MHRCPSRAVATACPSKAGPGNRRRPRSELRRRCDTDTNFDNNQFHLTACRSPAAPHRVRSDDLVQRGVKREGDGRVADPGWKVAAWKACGDCQRATLTKRNVAVGERLRCRRVERYPGCVLRNAQARSQACRNASSSSSGTSNALIKTAGSAFMIVVLLGRVLAAGGLEPGANRLRRWSGR